MAYDADGRTLQIRHADASGNAFDRAFYAFDPIGRPQYLDTLYERHTPSRSGRLIRRPPLRTVLATFTALGSSMVKRRCDRTRFRGGEVLILRHSLHGKCLAATRLGQQMLQGFHPTHLTFLRRLDDTRLKPANGLLDDAPVNVVPVLPDVCCEGNELMEYFDPPLSSVEMPIAEMVRVAWETLQRRIAAPEEPARHLELPFAFKLRESAIRAVELA